MYSDLLENLSKKIDHYFSEIEASFGFDYGPEFEIALCKILKELLPTKFGVCRGFIIDKYGCKAGDDIIIYDRMRFPTIRMLNDDFAQKEQVPIEAVYCYIEAKHNLELDNTGDCTFNKALDQLHDIKRLKRSERSLNQITETFSLDKSMTATAPAGWTKILNPIHTSIISRKTSLKKDTSDKEFKKGPLVQDTTYRLLKKFPLSTDSIPDLIVAGDGVIVLPTYKVNDLSQIMPIFCLDKNNSHLVLKTKYNALAVGLCQILWALERIQLGVMPWEEIIGNGLHESHLKP